MRRLLSTAAMIALGLAGGWPASVSCARAHAEFIRRITPWPVEPPLQIWRCPMRTALEAPDPVERLYRLAGFNPRPSISLAPEMETLHLAQAVGRGADIDVTDPAFEFIRSIDVFQVTALQNQGRGECNRYASVRQGTYDGDGQFRWQNSSVSALPPAFRGTERYGQNCPSIWIRAVFVDWEDFEGTYGFEQVHY